MSLKELRLSKKMTQAEAAHLLKVSLRSYKTYENDERKAETIKYQYMLKALEEYHPIDETHGILSIDDIAEICAGVFDKYFVNYAYLFGSYAKNKATGKSDVDLLVSANLTGIRFFGLVEELKSSLHKSVDVLNPDQLNNNQVLLNEILKDGVKIYG